MYDGDLEASAQAWADGCDFTHGGISSEGQNIYATTSTQNCLAPAVTSWYDEVNFYDLDSNTCQSGKVCGHYTQVGVMFSSLSKLLNSL